MTREEFISMMGYRDDSPLRNEDSLDIKTGPNGIIDMSNTGTPLTANGRYLPPYSGHHQFYPNSTVTEVPLVQKGFEVPKRQGVRINSDGSESSHIMKTETDGNGNWFSFPTLFQDPDGNWIDMSIQAEKNWLPVYEEAKRRGEVIDFGTDKEAAIKFGEGSWKPNMKHGGSLPKYQSRGESYSEGEWIDGMYYPNPVQPEVIKENTSNTNKTYTGNKKAVILYDNDDREGFFTSDLERMTPHLNEKYGEGKWTSHQTNTTHNAKWVAEMKAADEAFKANPLMIKWRQGEDDYNAGIITEEERYKQIREMPDQEGYAEYVKLRDTKSGIHNLKKENKLSSEEIAAMYGSYIEGMDPNGEIILMQHGNGKIGQIMPSELSRTRMREKSGEGYFNTPGVTDTFAEVLKDYLPEDNNVVCYMGSCYQTDEGSEITKESGVTTKAQVGQWAGFQNREKQYGSDQTFDEMFFDPNDYSKTGGVYQTSTLDELGNHVNTNTGGFKPKSFKDLTADGDGIALPGELERLFSKDYYKLIDEKRAIGNDKEKLEDWYNNLIKDFKDGGSLPKYQAENSEVPTVEKNVPTTDVDGTEARTFQKTKVSSNAWLDRVMAEQADRGNPITMEQAIAFQSQSLADLDNGIIKQQTARDFFTNPQGNFQTGNLGPIEGGTQGFNISGANTVWNPLTGSFVRADAPVGQKNNIMLIGDRNGYSKPWTLNHEMGHNWNSKNPFGNDPSRQFLGKKYFSNAGMFNTYNPELTGDEYDHTTELGTNLNDYAQYQQSSPELRSEKAALEKELFDLGIYDPTREFTETDLKAILDNGNLSGNAREFLNGLGYKDLLKEKRDVIQAQNAEEYTGLPTALLDQKQEIERMYSSLGSRYATNSNMTSDNWGDMADSEKEKHIAEFGTTLREMPDGYGGTETREVSDLEYESHLRRTKNYADLELYGEDAVFGETSLTGGVNSPGYFAYDMENISNASNTLTGYMDDFLNTNQNTPMLHEIKNLEGIIIGYSDDPNYSGIGTPDNMLPWTKENQETYNNQGPFQGGTPAPTEAQWTTYVDNLFAEEESYNADDPDYTWSMKDDESLDYTWPAEEGDDDYDPDNIQKNNSLYDLCYDKDGNPTGNPDCTESHIKRIEDNKTRHAKHRKIDQLGYNAASIVDIFGNSTSVHVKSLQSMFTGSGGVTKTGPNSPLIEGHYSEMFPEGTPEYDARQRLVSQMNILKAKNPGERSRLDKETLTAQFILDMQTVQDALVRTRKSLQKNRQGLVDEYYKGVNEYRNADHEQIIIEQQKELDDKLKNNNITNFMNRVYSQNDEETNDDLPAVTNARYGAELPRFQDKGENKREMRIATEKSIYPDGEYNWYNPADSYRYLTNENETIPLEPLAPESAETIKNRSEIPLNFDEYKIEKPKGTIEQYRKYIRNPKYNDWRMHSFNPSANITDKGWVEKDYYRNLDKEGVEEVQEWLNENGYNIKKDGDWGDQTYNNLNNYLLDSKLLNKETVTDPLITDDLLIMQQYIESDGKPKAGSSKGALGLVQAMEDSWADAIKKGVLPENAKRTNANHSLLFQRYYMNGLMNAGFVQDGTSNDEKVARALSGYNWGRGNTPNFFNNINYVATNKTIKDKKGKVIESGFRNKLDKDGNPILVPEAERRDPFDMNSWMTILDTDKESTRWTIPKETVDYINLIMYPEKYIKAHGQKAYDSRIKSPKKLEDYKKKAGKFFSFKNGGEFNRTRQLIREYKSGGELSGLAKQHLQEIGIIPEYKDGGMTHSVNDKESLLNVAARYNTTEKDINERNNLIEKDPLYMGQVLDIPETIVKTPLEIKKESYKLGDYGLFKSMTLDNQVKLYSKYVNADYSMFSEKVGKKLYDKLNRVYYVKARESNMSVLDYMKSILS